MRYLGHNIWCSEGVWQDVLAIYRRQRHPFWRKRHKRSMAGK